MTNEEIEKEILDISKSLDELSELERPLTKDEKKSESLLLLKKAALEKMKAAKEKGDWNQEVSGAIDYALLKSFGEKHPYLMRLARSKFWFRGF